MDNLNYESVLCVATSKQLPLLFYFQPIITFEAIVFQR